MNALEATTMDFLKAVLDKRAEVERLVRERNQSVSGASGAPSTAPKRVSVLGGAGGAAKKSTLGSVFKSSLIELMSTINSTQVHYIRCIKPNEAKSAWGFEANMVLAQLRACGVLETIRISSMGYPSRRTLEEFVDRYYVLTHSSYWKEGPREVCDRILRFMIPGSEQYQLGKTKIFFRAGQLGRLEQLRTEKLKRCVILIQKCMYGAMMRRKYLALRQSTIMVQRSRRAKQEARQLRRVRDDRSATLIQKNWRGYQARRDLKAKKRAATLVQAQYRGWSARRKYTHLREETATRTIQRVTRGWLARREYARKLQSIIFIQSCLRRRLARRELLRLRKEARSADHHKEVSYKLENKVMELQRSLTAQTTRVNELVESQGATELKLRTWKDKCRKLEGRNRELADRILSNAKEQQEALQFLMQEKGTLEERCTVLTGRIGGLDREVKRLTQELASKQEEIGRLQEERKWEGKKTPVRLSMAPPGRTGARPISPGSPRAMGSPKLVRSPSGRSQIPRKMGSLDRMSSGTLASTASTLIEEEGDAARAASALHRKGAGGGSAGGGSLSVDEGYRKGLGPGGRRLTEGLLPIPGEDSGPVSGEMERRGSAGATISGSGGRGAGMKSTGSMGRLSMLTDSEKAKRQTMASLEAVATVRGRLGYGMLGAEGSGSGGGGHGSSRSNRISFLMRSSNEAEKDKLGSILASEGLVHEVVNGLIRNLTGKSSHLKILGGKGGEVYCERDQKRQGGSLSPPFPSSSFLIQSPCRI